MRSQYDLTLVGPPSTHEHFLRRHHGTYGPVIRTDQGLFPRTAHPIKISGVMVTFPGAWTTRRHRQRHDVSQHPGTCHVPHTDKILSAVAGDLPMNLRLYLDTADTTAWETWLPVGIFYGVTSNPLLLERAQVPCTISSLAQLATKAFSLGAREVQLQTWGETKQALIATGKALADIDQRVVVKIPITKLGTEAAAALIAENIRVTMTAVYESPQILLAAALGADYAAPYLGRINDSGRNGRETLTQMQQALDGIQSSTRILTASIRDADDIAYLAAQGLTTFTFSPHIAKALFSSQQTANATAAFERSAKAMAKNSR